MTPRKKPEATEFAAAHRVIRLLLKDLCTRNRPRSSSAIAATVEKLLVIAAHQSAPKERAAVLDAAHELVYGIGENAMDDRLDAIAAIIALFLDASPNDQR